MMKKLFRVRRFLPALILALAMCLLPAVSAQADTVYSTPELKSAACVYGGVKVSWNSVADAPAYRIYRMSAGTAWTVLGDSETTSYIDTTAVSGETYTYTVRVISALGKGTVSGYDRTGVSVTYIEAPEIQSVQNTVSGVKLNWNSSRGAVNYSIFRKTSSTGWSWLANSTSTAFTDTTVQSGTTYIYTVRCTSKDSKSYTSSYDPTGVSIQFLSAPTLSSVSSTAEGLSVKWNDVEGAVNYRVFRKNARGSWKYLKDSTSCSIVDDNVVSGTTYSYTVRCISADGTTATSGFDNSGISGLFVSVPEPVSTTNMTNGVKIQWKAPEGAENYYVFRKTASTGWKKIASTTANTFTDTKAASGTTYSYTVRCTSADQSYFTSYYNTVGISATYYAPPELTKISAAASKGITISWNSVNGANKYRIFRRTNGGSYESVGDTDKLTYTDTTATTGGATYNYTVRCINAAGTVALSAYNKKGLTLTYCAVPKNQTVTSAGSYKGALIKWRASTGAVKYTVFRKADGSKSWKNIGSTTGCSFTDAKGLSGVYYTYTVRCVTEDGLTATSGYDAAGVTILYTGPYSSQYEYYDEKCMRIWGDTTQHSYGSASEAEADMTNITVKVWDFKSGSSGAKVTRSYTISVHKNIAASVKKIFEEIYNGDEKFPIHSLGGYSWRGAGSSSEHCLGLAIDINPDENPMIDNPEFDSNGNYIQGTGTVSVGNKYEPGVNPYSIPADGDVVNAFRKYGFDWGIWSSRVDFMHFSYFGR